MWKRVRPATRWVLITQATLWGLIGVFGFSVTVIGNALAITQVPGIWLVMKLGWCCGIGGGFILSDAPTNRWGGLSLEGAPVLAIANTLVVLAVVVPLVAINGEWRVRSRAG